MTQTITSSLQTLGLTPNEITIYTYLLRKGLSSGKEIIDDNDLDKSSTYEALANLKQKQLIHVIGKKRNQNFAPVPAQKLQELLENQRHQLDKVATDIDTFIQDIDAYAKQSYQNKNIRIFEGPDEFLTWSRSRFEIPNTTLRTLTSWNLHETYLPNYNKNYDEETVKLRLGKNINIKALIKKEDQKNRKNSLNVTNPKILKEVRILPETFIIESSLATYGPNISFLSKKANRFLGVIIEDKLICSLVNNMFDLIWQGCEEA